MEIGVTPTSNDVDLGIRVGIFSVTAWNGYFRPASAMTTVNRDRVRCNALKAVSAGDPFIRKMRGPVSQMRLVTAGVVMDSSRARTGLRPRLVMVAHA